MSENVISKQGRMPWNVARPLRRAAKRQPRPLVNKVQLMRGLIGGALIIVLFVVWYLSTGPLALIAPVKFPSIPDVYEALGYLTQPGYAGATLLGHIGSSLGLVVLGFLVAAFTGVSLGLWMGWSRKADAFLNPVFQIIRPIAPIAWIPLTILWFGLGTSAKIFVIWLAAFAPALINTHTGIRNVSPVLIEAAKVYGASSQRLLWSVAVPSALPTIFTGLRMSLQACWMVLVAAELVGSFTGLGHILIIATRDLDPSMILIAMLCIALLGMLMTWMLSMIERRVMPWRP
ncbi:MAG TPA: ABC transporter permease [Candidimonas sp.]|nr:ABC transporter permease [Candidimonas sp.]